MTIDFTMARVLKAYPGANDRYQGVTTDTPILLQPVDVDPTAANVTGPGGTYLAALAPVQIGSRLTLVLPWMVVPDGAQPAPETTYRYVPVWRLRPPPVGHFPPFAPPVLTTGGGGMAVSWLGADIVPTAPSAIFRPIIPPQYPLAASFVLSNGDLQPAPPISPYYVAPWSRYELEVEADEFGLLVQPTGPTRNWDFAPGGLDANFAAQYLSNPVPPLGYLKQAGAYILTGERSP